MAIADSHSEEQRGRILELARELFFRYGFTKVTIDEIAAELHISKTTFYNNFSSKEDLLDKVIDSYYQTIRDGISHIMAEGSGYLETLRKILLFIGEMLKRMDARAQDDIRTSSPKTWQNLKALQLRTVHSSLEKVIRKGIEIGFVRRDTYPKMVADFLIMTIENILNGEETLSSMASSVQNTLQAMVDLLLHGILVYRKSG